MFDQLHADIIARLGADITGLATLAAYPDLQQVVPLPAVLIDMDSLAPDEFGDATVGFRAMFTAYCIVDPTLSDAEMQVRNLAAEVAIRVVQERNFGNADVVEAVELLTIGPNDWKPELMGYQVWGVHFMLGVSAGEGYWQFDPLPGVPVQTVTVGTASTLHGENYAAPGEHTDAGGDDIPLSQITETLPQE